VGGVEARLPTTFLLYVLKPDRINNRVYLQTLIGQVDALNAIKGTSVIAWWKACRTPKCNATAYKINGTCRSLQPRFETLDDMVAGVMRQYPSACRIFPPSPAADPSQAASVAIPERAALATLGHYLAPTWQVPGPGSRRLTPSMPRDPNDATRHSDEEHHKTAYDIGNRIFNAVSRPAEVVTVQAEDPMAAAAAAADPLRDLIQLLEARAAPSSDAPPSATKRRVGLEDDVLRAFRTPRRSVWRVSLEHLEQGDKGAKVKGALGRAMAALAGTTTAADATPEAAPSPAQALRAAAVLPARNIAWLDEHRVKVEKKLRRALRNLRQNNAAAGWRLRETEEELTMWSPCVFPSPQTDCGRVCARMCGLPAGQGPPWEEEGRTDAAAAADPRDAVDRHHSLDFVGGLPEVYGKNGILTIVDRRSKEVRAVPMWLTDGESNAEAVVDALLEHVCQYTGPFFSIMSDRGTQFTSRLFRDITERLGVSLCMSTAYHPETDGQTERYNNKVLAESLAYEQR
jgi:transposase InsO family protein